jgi:hypothetical protein
MADIVSILRTQTFFYALIIFFLMFISGGFDPSYPIETLQDAFSPIDEFVWESGQLDIPLALKMICVFLVVKRNSRIKTWVLMLLLFSFEMVTLVNGERSSFLLHLPILFVETIFLKALM